MFGGKTRSTGHPGGGALSAIGADVTITGDIVTEGDLHLDGTVRGDVTCGSLVLGASGAIEGAVRAREARLAGRVEGSVDVGTLTVLRGARLNGDVSYRTIAIEAGAVIDGRMIHHAEGEEANHIRLVAES